jgi:hypothetical protein
VTTVTLSALPHQLAVLSDTTSREIASTSGVGGGKTWTGGCFMISRSLWNPPTVKGLVVAPVWPIVRRVTLPTFEKLFDVMNEPWDYNKNEGEITWDNGRRKIWLASGERPENLSGPTVGYAWQDEPAIQDAEVRRRMASRVRDADAVISQILYTGTHEGLGWFHELTQKIKTVKSTSYDNPFNPKEYLDSLRDVYPDEARFRMYVMGIASALAGTIYTQLREHHFRPLENVLNGETFLMWDFNVDCMVTLVANWIGGSGGHIHVWGEVVTTGGTTTDVHARRVADFLQNKGVAQRGDTMLGHTRQLFSSVTADQIEAICDAAAKQRKTSSIHTDEDLVRQCGFKPILTGSNPPVSERVQCMQYALTKNRVFIDEKGAPKCAKAIREHAYKKNSDPPEPQKQWRQGELQLDHFMDALGYGVLNKVPLHVRRLMVS